MCNKHFGFWLFASLAFAGACTPRTEPVDESSGVNDFDNRIENGFSLWLTDEILNGLVKMEISLDQIEKLYGKSSAIFEAKDGKVHIFNLSLEHPDLLQKGERVGFNAVVVNGIVKSWTAVELGSSVPAELLDALKSTK